MAHYLCIWVRAYWFSVTSFSKWLPVGHIRFFGFWTTWFRQRNTSLLWNFSFKFHVHVRCGCRQKCNDCELCRFENGCPVILNNMFNCNPPIAHCYPLLWGGGILVDHWAIISSLFRLVWKVVCCLSTKQDGGTTWPIFDGCGTPDRTARLHGTGRLRSVTGPAGWRLSREAQLKFPTRQRMTGRLGGWRVSRGARLGSEWRARDRGRPSRRCWPSTWWWRPSRRCWPGTWWWRPGRCGRLSTPSGLGNGWPSWDTCSRRGPSISCQAFEQWVVQVQESHDSHKFWVESYRGGAICRPAFQVPSTQEVRGFQRVCGGTAQLRRVRMPQITKWGSQARGDEPVVQGTPAGNTPAAR